MINNLPRCLEFDLNQQNAARVTCQIPLYTLFVPLYSLWEYSFQLCSRGKKVLRSAEMLVASLGVTSSWGRNCQAVIDAKRVDTVQGCDYYFTYNTIISLITYIIGIIAKKEFAIWPGIHWKKEVQSIRHQARLELVSNGSRFDSAWKHQRALPHWRAGSRGCVLRIGLTHVGNQLARMAVRNWSPKSSTVLAIAAWSSRPRSWCTWP